MEDLLRDQMVDLFDDLNSVAPRISEFVLARMYFDQEIAPKVLMERFIKFVYPYRLEIQNRDEAFFLTNNAFVKMMNFDKAGKYVDFFRELWQSQMFTKSDREAIWDHLNAMIDTCQQYQKA